MRFEIVRLGDAQAERERSGELSREFLRVPALSLSVHELPAGVDDPQQPHAEDEVYYVRRRAPGEVRGGRRTAPRPAGRRRFRRPRGAAQVHEIEDDLTLLVVFAPAKSR